MKRTRLMLVLVTLVAITAVISGPVGAAIYQDVLTVSTVGLIDPAGNGNDLSLNVLGLDLVNFNESFDLVLTYDSDTGFSGANGGFSFGSSSPDNTFSLTFTGTDGSLTYDETNDYGFNLAFPPIPSAQGPKAFFLPDPFDPAASVWTWISYNGGMNVVPGVTTSSLFISDDPTKTALSFLGGDGSVGLDISLAVDIAGFDILNDRTAVPIPGTLLLLAPGLVGLLGIRRRFSKS